MSGPPREARGFWTFWTAATVSGFGDYISILAIRVLVARTLHGGAAAVGLVNAARWLPYLLFGLIAGVLVDRARRHPLMVATDLARALLLCAIPVLSALGSLNIGVLAAVMAVFGLFSLANDAASLSFIPRLVPAALLGPATARLDQSDAVAQTSGPALAGGLIALVGAPIAVLADALSYLVSGLVLLRVRVEEPAPTRVTLRGVPEEAREGLRWVYTHPTLRPLALGAHGWFLVNAATGAIVLPYALDTLRMGVFGLGLCFAAAGIGSLLGSLYSVRLGLRIGVGWIDIAAYASNGVAWLVIALSGADLRGWLVFGAGMLLYGIGLGIENANGMGYRMRATPDRLQARMSATMRSINRAMIVVGAPLGGLLADEYGYRAVLIGTAAGFAVIALALIPTPFRHARFGDAYTPD